MLNKELISSDIPTLSLTDSALYAIDMMNEHQLSQMPVVSGDQYHGLVFEQDLLNIDEAGEVGSLSNHFSRVAVKANRHFLESVQTSNDYNLSIIPVIENENDFAGVILATDLLKHLGKITGASIPGGLIVLEIDQRNFSFAEISKLVETNDAQITQLNTYWDTSLDAFFVTIKINKFEISDIIATFQRYDYNVKYYFGEEMYENELRNNYDHLMNYLSI